MIGWLLDALGWSRFARLTRQARSPDTPRRALAAAGFGELPEARSAAALVALMADHEPSVLAAVKASLARLGPLAIPPLVEGLKSPREAVAKLAAEALGEPGDGAAVAPLLHALKYAPRPVQLAARRSLERLGPLSVPALEAASGDPQPWVKRQIEEALEAIANPST